MNQVCTGQSSDSERASAEWQSAAVTPQFNASFSLVTRVSKRIYCYRELTVSIIVSAIAVSDWLTTFCLANCSLTYLQTQFIGKLKP